MVNNFRVFQPKKSADGSSFIPEGTPFPWTGLFEPVVAYQTLVETLYHMRNLTHRYPDWMSAYEQAKKFFHQHGHLRVPRGTHAEADGIPFLLDVWVNDMRNAYHRENFGRLKQDAILLLEEIGMEWEYDPDWEEIYEMACLFYREFHHLHITRKNCPPGYALDRWLIRMRRRYYGKIKPALTEEQIEKLNALGVVWDSYHDLSWERSYLEAKAYYERFGDLLVPAKYISESGFPLGVWISRMRTAKANQRESILNAERIRKLEEIGMTWDALSEQWERNYLEAAAYYREHGNLLVPGTYTTETGLKLGNWISHLRVSRKQGKLTEEQIARLNIIGMAWDADEERWRIGYEAALQYSREHGNLKVPATYETPEGYTLGLWINLKRRQYKKGTLTERQILDLEKLGMRWRIRSFALENAAR